MPMTIMEALAVGQMVLGEGGKDERRKDPSRAPTPGRRMSGRHRVLLSALVVDLDMQSVIGCRVENVSEGGARIRLAERRFLPPTFWLIAVTSGLAFKAQTIWRKDDRLGVEVGLSVDLADPQTRDERLLNKIWAVRR